MTVGELIELLGKYDPNALVGSSTIYRQANIQGASDVVQMDTQNYWDEKFSNIVVIRTDPRQDYGMDLAEWNYLNGKT